VIRPDVRVMAATKPADFPKGIDVLEK
jgi:hypothetical protein